MLAREGRALLDVRFSQVKDHFQLWETSAKNDAVKSRSTSARSVRARTATRSVHGVDADLTHSRLSLFTALAETRAVFYCTQAASLGQRLVNQMLKCVALGAALREMNALFTEKGCIYAELGLFCFLLSGMRLSSFLLRL